MKTNIEIEAMPAGPEMDALVKKLIVDRDGYPSTDIAAAWEVVEKMKSLGYSFATCDGGLDKPTAAFMTIEDKADTESQGDTVQLAICRAALKAVLK